jgi:hypothetical protein
MYISDRSIRIYRLDRLNVHNRSILSYTVDCHRIVTKGGVGVSAELPRVAADLPPSSSHKLYHKREREHVFAL